MKIMIINGPNLNRLGHRDTTHYGVKTYEQLCDEIKEHAKKENIEVDIRQNNCEGRLIDFIQEADVCFDGIVINPGAYSHYSYAIMDAFLDAKIPIVEVHLSNVENREAFRKVLITAKGCDHMISGKGFKGYMEAIDHIIERGEKK